MPIRTQTQIQDLKPPSERKLALSTLAAQTEKRLAHIIIIHRHHHHRHSAKSERPRQCAHKHIVINYSLVKSRVMCITELHTANGLWTIATRLGQC